MFDFYEILDRRPPKLTIVDVGAASLEDTEDVYHLLANRSNVKTIGFEPNRDACSERNAEAKPGQRYFPYFIGDGRRRTFYMCENPCTSSLYEPDSALLDKFQQINIPVVGTQEVDTVRLDDIAEIDDCDFLKIDIQGAELDAINGAIGLIKETVVIHTEVEFIPMYKDQPLFGDVDVKLREQGFLLHKFEKIFTRIMRPLSINNVNNVDFKQVLFAEAAIYVRNFMTFDGLSPNKLINLACLMHTIYGSYDMCAVALASVDKQEGTDLQTRYLKRLTNR